MKFNPRYVNYARVCGHTPEEQMDYDRMAWPDGVATPFKMWLKARIVEAQVEIPLAFSDKSALTNDNLFDEWLDNHPVINKHDE